MILKLKNTLVNHNVYKNLRYGENPHQKEYSKET